MQVVLQILTVKVSIVQISKTDLIESSQNDSLGRFFNDYCSSSYVCLETNKPFVQNSCPLPFHIILSCPFVLLKRNLKIIFQLHTTEALLIVGIYLGTVIEIPLGGLCF